MKATRVAVALIGAAFLALAACGGSDPVVGEPAGDQARCVQDATDCDDTPTDGAGDPASACMVGTPDCNDTPGEGEPASGGSMNMCVADAPDCNDMQEGGEPQGIAEGEPNGSDAPGSDDAPETVD